MKWKIGDVYRAKTGEIVEVAEFSDTEFCFRVRHPVTLEYGEGALYGPIENLDIWSKAVGLEKIDLNSYEPTGLNHDSSKSGKE